MTIDELNLTALAALSTITGQVAAGEISGPEAQRRLQVAARQVAWQRYQMQSRAIQAEMTAGIISPLQWQSRTASAVRAYLAETGQREALS